MKNLRTRRQDDRGEGPWTTSFHEHTKIITNKRWLKEWKIFYIQRQRKNCKMVEGARKQCNQTPYHMSGWPTDWENKYIAEFLPQKWKFVFFFFCSEFCHTLKWNSHGFTCVPHPDPPSHLPLHPLPLGLPSAPGPSACLMHPTWAGDLFHPR